MLHDVHLNISDCAPTFLQRLVIGCVNRAGFDNGALRKYGAQLVNFLRGGPIDFDYHGLRLRLDPALCGSARHMIMTPNWSDRREARFLVEQTPENGVFVDIGANAGFYTFLIAAKRPNASVVAFDPWPAMAEALAANIARNNLRGVSLHSHALSDADGTEMIDGRNVPTTTLLQAIAGHGITSIDTLKIDIEGMEMKVLVPFFRDAKKSLWPRAVIIEHIFNGECLDFLKGRGYRETFRTKLNAALIRD